MAIYYFGGEKKEEEGLDMYIVSLLCMMGDLRLETETILETAKLDIVVSRSLILLLLYNYCTIIVLRNDTLSPLCK